MKMPSSYCRTCGKMKGKGLVYCENCVFGDSFLMDAQFWGILPYADKIRDLIEEMKKTTGETDFVIFVSREICHGGFKLFGCEVISHVALEKGTIYIMKLSDLEYLPQYWDAYFKETLDGILSKVLRGQKE